MPVLNFAGLRFDPFFACLLFAAMLQPAPAYGQVDDAKPRLGDLVGGSASTYCSLGVKHDIANAVDVFGTRLALKLPIPQENSIPGHEILPMDGVLSVPLGAAEVSAYENQYAESTDSVMWVRVGDRLGFSQVLKDEAVASVVRCKVGGREVAFVSALNLNGKAYDLYVFDDGGRLVTTIKGHVRFNVPLVTVDDAGRFSISGTGLSINGRPTWPRGYPAKDDPRVARFLARLDASSASPAWKRSLTYSLSAHDDGTTHEIFFPRVFVLGPDGRVVEAPPRLRREFYVKVAQESSSEFMAGSDEYGIFTHDLTLPIFVRVLAEAGIPGYAMKQWNALPDKLKQEIELDLLIDFWRLKQAPEVGAAFNHK